MRNVLAVCLFAILAALLPSAALAGGVTSSHTYINMSEAQVLTAQVYTADDALTASSMVRVMNATTLASVSSGATVTTEDDIDAKALAVFGADSGKTITGTFSTDDGSCTRCPLFVLVLQNGPDVYLFMMVDMDGQLTTADATVLAKYGADVVQHAPRSVAPPAGFEVYDSN